LTFSTNIKKNDKISEFEVSNQIVHKQWQYYLLSIRSCLV